MHNVYGVAVMPIENAAGRFHHLTVAKPTELWRLRATLGVLGKLLDMGKYPLNQFARGRWILEGYVIGNAVEGSNCGVRPNYFSHRAMRSLALACETTRPSSIARSPRAIPSSSAIRRPSAS
jgi:hypothetical protein